MAANDPVSLLGLSESDNNVTPEIPLVTAKAKKEVHFNPEKNHGRTAADDYTGCPIVEVPHELLSSESYCPKCVAEGHKPKLTQLKPKKIVILAGMPIVSGTRYHCLRYHCNLCGENYFSKEEIRLSRKPKYAPSCASSIVINRYIGGQPFYRTQMLQNLHGVPLADATQWDITKKLYQDCVSPIFLALEEIAALASEHAFDDTPNRVLSLKAEKKSAHTTSIIAREGEQTIQLYYTGTAVARENLTALIAKRTIPSMLLTM